MAEDAECIPGTDLVNNRTHERVPRRTTQLKEEKLWQKCMLREKSTNVARHRTDKNQLDDSPGVGKPLVEATISEVLGTTPVADDDFARAWRGELGRELCGMAEDLRQNPAMNTMSSEEMRWMDEQVRYSTAAIAWDHVLKQREWCSLR